MLTLKSMFSHGGFLTCAILVVAILCGWDSTLEASGTSEDRRTERLQMVRGQIRARGVADEATLSAMRAVPRHLFVASGYEEMAYADRPLPIGHGQTISQPYIVAAMTEALAIKPGDRVLEVGTGSGYQAAVLAEITDEVLTIEIVGALAKRSAKTLRESGYEKVQVRHADGFYGWKEKAPFDAIIVAAAPDSIPAPLIAQLKPGGRMVIPVGSVFGGQRLLLVIKHEDGTIRTRTLMPVRFVPFTREKR